MNAFPRFKKPPKQKTQFFEAVPIGKRSKTGLFFMGKCSFSANKPLSLHKIGCGSAKDFKRALSFALTLHYLCTTNRQDYAIQKNFKANRSILFF